MLITLIIVCLLVWVPILFVQINQRGFYILLIWLLIAPFATNAIQYPSRNPFFSSSQGLPDNGFTLTQRSVGWKESRTGAYHLHAQSVTLREVLNPTRLLFVTFFLLTILERITRHRTVLPLNRTEKMMGGFVLFLLINVVLFSGRLAYGLRTAIDMFLVPFLAYYVARRFITSEDRFRKLVFIFMSLAVALISIGFIERVVRPETLHRVRGPFSHRNYYYMVIMVIFFASMAETASHWFTRLRSHLPTIVRFFVICCAPLVIALTLTRGNVLGLICGICLFITLGQRFIHVRKRVLLIGLLFTIIPLVLITSAMTLNSVGEELNQRVSGDSTWYGRLATYSAVIQQVGKSPLVGIGFNNLRDVLVERSVAIQGQHNYTTSHQSFLALLAETGAIGFSLYLAVVICLVQTGVRLFKQSQDPRARWRGISILAMLAGYYIPAQLAHIIYSETFMHLYLYTYIGALAGLYEPSRRNAIYLTSRAPRIGWRQMLSAPEPASQE